MKTVNFKYDINDKVVTLLGDKGIVEWLCVNDSNTIQYYVKTSNNNDWFREDQIKPNQEML